MSEPEPQRQPEAGVASRLRESLGHEPRLALGTRIALFVIGWTLLLIGVAGLALPGIQGILTILIGAAVLSLVSESVYRLLRRLLHRRFPGAWERLDRFRQRVRDRLHRKRDR